MKEKLKKGIIKAEDDLGTIHKLYINCENGDCESILIDHRMYTHILETEQCILGRDVEYIDGAIYFTDTGDHCE